MVVRVRAEKTGGDFSNDLEFNVTVSCDPELRPQMLQLNHTPSLRAHFFGSTGEIKIEEISKGCIHPKQAFIASTINQIRELVPGAKTIYLANVLHSYTSEIINNALQRNDGLPLDSESRPGPLISGILKSRGTQIVAVKEARGNYIGLRASLST